MNTKCKCCLLVEDDPEDQEIFIDILHEISSTTGCYAVSNGEEALSALLDQKIVPDYIFTDIHMPKMDGLAFLKILKGIDEFQHIPVIVFTSDCSDEQIKILRTLGAVAIYSKTRVSSLRTMLNKYFADAQATPIL